MQMPSPKSRPLVAWLCMYEKRKTTLALKAVSAPGYIIISVVHGEVKLCARSQESVSEPRADP